MTYWWWICIRIQSWINFVGHIPDPSAFFHLSSQDKSESCTTFWTYTIYVSMVSLGRLICASWTIATMHTLQILSLYIEMHTRFLLVFVTKISIKCITYGSIVVILSVPMGAVWTKIYIDFWNQIGGSKCDGDVPGNALHTTNSWIHTVEEKMLLIYFITEIVKSFVHLMFVAVVTR